MTPVLVGAGRGLAGTLLGTPVAVPVFPAGGWGQRIREDGPHSHLEKMGTPTMGGTVILIGIFVAYLAARVVFEGFTAVGLCLLAAAAGLGLIGFVDDFIHVW